MDDEEPLPPLKSADKRPWPDVGWASFEREGQVVCEESYHAQRVLDRLRRRGFCYSHDGRLVPYDEDEQMAVQNEIRQRRLSEVPLPLLTPEEWANIWRK